MQMQGNLRVAKAVPDFLSRVETLNIQCNTGWKFHPDEVMFTRVFLNRKIEK